VDGDADHEGASMARDNAGHLRVWQKKGRPTRGLSCRPVQKSLETESRRGRAAPRAGSVSVQAAGTVGGGGATTGGGAGTGTVMTTVGTGMAVSGVLTATTTTGATGVAVPLASGAIGIPRTVTPGGGGAGGGNAVCEGGVPTSEGGASGGFA